MSDLLETGICAVTIADSSEPEKNGEAGGDDGGEAMPQGKNVYSIVLTGGPCAGKDSTYRVWAV